MDEDEFRKHRAAIPGPRCPFAKALLATCAACQLAGRINLAERELIICHESLAQQRCQQMHDLLRHNFGFAIGTLHDDAPLPHAQEMRIQCGGLRGLHDVLHGTPDVADANSLMDDVLQRWPDPEALPYSAVVHAARLHYKGRHG